MAAYTPTTWVNDAIPPMTAANLNKLVNELKSQAAALSIAHTLPTWNNGVSPAITDPVPWNEMERVLRAVSVALGITAYLPTAWNTGWTPARNATNLNRMESQAATNRTALDARTGPVRPFLSTSAFNQPIPSLPTIHPNSAAMLSSGTSFLLAGGTLDPYKEWVGPRQRAMYWHGDTSKLPRISVYVNYINQVGYACATTPRQMPLPPGWDTMTAQLTYDGIMWISDSITGDCWETYRITPPGVASMDINCNSNRWNAVRMDYFPGEEKTGKGYGYGYGQSGSDILTGLGLLRPEDFTDVSVGSVIPHALRMNWWSGSNGATNPVWVLPADAGDGQQAAGVPMGARVQLDPTLDIENWASVNAKAEPWRSALKKILRTMQVYGFVGVDTSGGPGGGGVEAAVAASVAPYVYPWEQAGYGWSYNNGIPYDLMSHFRVIDWRVWTGA